MPPFEVDGRHSFDAGVPPERVVPGFDPEEDGEASLAPGAEGETVDELTLESGEEAFAERVVVAVADRAH